MYFRTRVQIPAPPFITSLGRVPFYFPALAARSRPAFGWLPPGARLLFVSVGAAPLHSPPRCALAASLRLAPLRRSLAPCLCRCGPFTFAVLAARSQPAFDRLPSGARLLLVSVGGACTIVCPTSLKRPLSRTRSPPLRSWLSDPQTPLPILGQARDEPRGETVGHGVILNATVRDAAQAGGPRPQPHISGAIRMDRVDVVTDQTLRT
jgi:hypothetical protein